MIRLQTREITPVSQGFIPLHTRTNGYRLSRFPDRTIISPGLSASSSN